jgi:hypothetical protein
MRKKPAESAAAKAARVYGQSLPTFSRRAPLPDAVKQEKDYEWRSWFKEVVQRRYETGNTSAALIPADDTRTGKTIVIGEFVKTLRSVFPDPLKKMWAATQAAAECWAQNVPPEVAEQSRLASFARGVLTIEVFSASLLSEIRQFHQATILEQLRANWTADIPLVKIRYRVGYRE